MAFTIAKQGRLEFRITESLDDRRYLEIVEWFTDFKCCYTIAILDWTSDEGPDLRYIGARPLVVNAGFSAFNKFVKKVLPPLFEYDTLSNYLTKAYPEALI